MTGNRLRVGARRRGVKSTLAAVRVWGICAGCTGVVAAVSWSAALGAPASPKELRAASQMRVLRSGQWQDDFQRDRTVNPAVWIKLHQQGDTSNGELECYEPTQVGLDRTRGLTETEQYVSRGFTCPRGTPHSSDPLHWQSGAIQMRSMRFTYARVVVRARMAGGDGAWPAIWLLGAACQRPNWLSNLCRWPSDSADAAEIDIAEDLGSNGRTTINQNVYTSSLSHPCTYNTRTTLSTRYHDYEVDWTAGSLVFKVDGRRTGCGITGSNVPSHPMFLIINTAACTTGSTCGLGANPATFPQTTSVAWVRVTR